MSQRESAHADGRWWLLGLTRSPLLLIMEALCR